MVERADAEFRAVVEMVEPEHRARFLAIVEHTDVFCMNHLEPLHREYEERQEQADPGNVDLMQFEPAWTLPSLLDRNPLVWMLPTKSGLIVDIRMRPRAEQVRAFEAGLIPYVPADRAEPDGVAGEEQAREATAVADVRRAKPSAPPVGPTLFDPQPGEPLVEPKPERPADIIGRIGPRATKGRQ